MITAAIRLRPFGLLDATTVASWLDGPGLGVPAGPVGSRWAERLIADARVCAWVAVAGNEPVAFVRLDVGPDRVAELTLAVAPRRRRTGIGTTVLGMALHQANALRVRRVHAIVDAANGPALAFFAECGFEEDGVPGAARRFVRWIHDGDREALEIEG